MILNESTGTEYLYLVHVLYLLQYTRVPSIGVNTCGYDSEKRLSHIHIYMAI